MPWWNPTARTSPWPVLIMTPVVLGGFAGCDDVQEATVAEPTVTPPVSIATKTPSAEDDAPTDTKRKLSDRQIGDAVYEDLVIDDGVPHHRINLDAQDGVVTLSGSVPHLLAYRRAASRAERVRGVRAVVNQLDVIGDGRSEAEIHKDVIEAVAVHPATEAFELDVQSTGSELTLRGEVDSWAERELAESVVAGVRGVTKVRNEIDVDYEATRPDDEIREDVESRLAHDIRVFDDRLEVAVDEGVVTITGTVASAAERRRAYADAWVAGVEKADTEGVKVKWWEKHVMRRPVKPADGDKSDEQAEAALESALKIDPRVIGAAPKVHVQVRDGTATLTGDVPSYDAKYASEQDALHTVGVWRVRNLLRVRPVPTVTDEDLEERIAAALDRNPYLDHLPTLRAHVENGAATLFGQVENAFQRDQAQWAAGQVDGVVDVRNSLTVIPSDDPVSDFVLRADVLQQLTWDPFVAVDDVEVTVHDGVVTLEGTVDDWRGHDAAVQNARAAGARRLVDDLEVKDGPALFAPGASDR